MVGCGELLLEVEMSSLFFFGFVLPEKIERTERESYYLLKWSIYVWEKTLSER